VTPKKLAGLTTDKRVVLGVRDADAFALNWKLVQVPVTKVGVTVVAFELLGNNQFEQDFVVNFEWVTHRGFALLGLVDLFVLLYLLQKKRGDSAFRVHSSEFSGAALIARNEKLGREQKGFACSFGVQERLERFACVTPSADPQCKAVVGIDRWLSLI